MTKIIFQNTEEVYNWIFNNITQNDSRYTPLIEEMDFFY